MSKDSDFIQPRPTPGRIVQVDHYTTPINGTRSSPAIVTQVWDTDPQSEHHGLPMVNVTMFGDAQAPSFRGSLYHVSDKRGGDEKQYAWRWPERA